MKAGYFVENPAAEIISRMKANRHKKEVIESNEYMLLLKTPCSNYDVRTAVISVCIPGLGGVI